VRHFSNSLAGLPELVGYPGGDRKMTKRRCKTPSVFTGIKHRARFCSSFFLAHSADAERSGDCEVEKNAEDGKLKHEPGCRNRTRSG